MSGEVARIVAERARTCPYVAALSTGRFGTVTTYLPGESVPGVSVRDDEIDVSVVANYGSPLPKIAAAVRDAIGDAAGGRRVNVTIADVRPIKAVEKAVQKDERGSS
ncbi:Asp23/Gls24 family envelope stress response protein [Planotetraspora kaengkrachanensis]|uniref:Asp23/Gls24 family envelope stress response protein n=1 Tax=Planotetraspora kaengkrachanensis TaxID=575193 RepID=A0A8J3Q1I3_9ACTN|nr:Asp23/Gls24 family envelope stress response protein [Planotetraspora kaengkrachanensis]GIG84801.1 hypothetical protein Pka01_79280 [Planotetraspora kaengkrachanensis]